MTTYFSVDIEATSTSVHTGELLTIGAEALDADGASLGLFYARLDVGYGPVIGDCDCLVDPDTHAFWLAQIDESPKAAAEIFDTGLVRHNPDTAARMFNEFVLHAGGDDRMQRVFVANPVSYDWTWIDRLFIRSGIDNPFSYRTLCLRSAAWGQDWKNDITQSVRTHTSLIPHDALWDARAQADDLRDLLRSRSEPATAVPA